MLQPGRWSQWSAVETGTGVLKPQGVCQTRPSQSQQVVQGLVAGDGGRGDVDRRHKARRLGPVK